MTRVLAVILSLMTIVWAACGASSASPIASPSGTTTSSATPISVAGVPAKATTTLAYIDAHHRAPDGFVGGTTYQNDGRGGGQSLPRKDGRAASIAYREWDVNRHEQGVNRGAERLITGSDGSAYYTADHYQTFRRIR